jgi:hypothetical protein
MDLGIKAPRLEIFEVEDFGDTAVKVSRFALLGEGDQVLDKRKYIVVWKREGGQRKLHRNIFSSSLPPAG